MGNNTYSDTECCWVDWGPAVPWEHWGRERLVGLYLLRLRNGVARGMRYSDIPEAASWQKGFIGEVNAIS